ASLARSISVLVRRQVARRLGLLWSALLLPAVASGQSAVSHAATQPRIAIRGVVLDAMNAAPLPGATVIELTATAGPTSAVHTGVAGTFVFHVAGRSARLMAMRVAFAPETLTVSAGDTAVAFHLHRAP